MAEIDFSDLIPAKSGGGTSAPAEISFDDLIPKKADGSSDLGFDDLIPKKSGTLASISNALSAAYGRAADAIAPVSPVASLAARGAQGAAQGAPVTVPMGMEAAKGVPVAGAYVPQIPEMTALEQEHPSYATAAKIEGGILGTLPMIGAAPEAFGASAGQGLLARTLLAGGSNAGLSAADTAARGGNADVIKNNAMLSALIGGGFPLAGAAARGAAAYGAPIVRNTISHENAFLPGMGWGTESAIAYLTHGTSEIPANLFRLGRGVYRGVKEANQAGAIAGPSQTALFGGALARQELADALVRQGQQR
jgi:hypothetical protein